MMIVCDACKEEDHGNCDLSSQCNCECLGEQGYYSDDP